jgi:enterobacterial common antigen flippase
MTSGVTNSQLADPPPDFLPNEEPIPPPRQTTSYTQILKSSTLVGGSSVLNTGIGILRTKALAVILGPAGFGLFGLYNSIANLTQSIAGVGINSSGVRQIAVAVGSNDELRIARTATILRRTSMFLGLIGAALLIVFSRQVSTMTFGTADHAGAVCLLSVAVLFQLISGGQTALIQGMRRIGDLAKMSVFGALFATLVSIPLVYYFRENGVVLSIIAVAAMTIVTSWWYSRKIRVSFPGAADLRIRQEVTALLKLGFGFMASGLVAMGIAYAVRVLVLRHVGFAAAGYYQSAWTLGGFYVGVILQAMAADFYPRLTAVIHDDSACNRLVNEQARISLLLAGPGIIGTLTFAPLVIAILYSARFAAAVGVLRWICLGAALQVITWPIGFIIVAKGRAGLLIFCEMSWGVVSLILAWFCVGHFGLNGAGIAFFGSYAFHVVLLYPIVNRLSGFTWSGDNLQTAAVFVLSILTVFCSFAVLPAFWATTIGIVASVASTVYSVRILTKLLSWDELPTPVRRLLAQVRLAPSV